MPFIDTPQGRFEGTKEQIDAYRRALNRPDRPASDVVKDESPDTITGADFMTRFGASFKMTPEGKRSYYADRYGADNVAVDERGEIMFREKKGGRFKYADESQVTLRDLADFAGDVPGAVMSAIGGAIGGAAGSVLPGAGTAAGAVAGASTGAALGNLAKQGVSALMPGSDQMAPVDRAISAGGDMALGGVSQGIASGGIKLMDMVRPRNLVGRSAINAAATPRAAEGQALSRDTGIPLSFAQETGSRAATTVEGMARRNPISADAFSSFDRLQTEKAVQRVNRIMDDLHASEVGDVSMGQSAQRAFDKLWDGLVSQRRGQAAKDFGAVDKMSKGSRVIPTTNTIGEIDDLIKQMDVPGGGDATAALVNRLKTVRKELGGVQPADQKVLLLDAQGQPLVTQGPFEKRMTAEELNRLLQVYGKAASGNGTVFQELDKAQQRLVAGRIHSALTRDLDAAAGAKLTDENVVAALKAARDNYAANSAKISEVGDSVIGRYFGNVAYERTPERVADTLTKMKPTEIRTTLELLKRADPEVADKTARYFLEKAVEKAVPPPSASQGGAVKFSASRFLSALPDDATQAALFGGRPAQGEITKVAKVLERVADRPMEGSPTAPLMMAWDLAKGLFTLNPQALAGLPASVLAPRAVAKAALTPQGRQALLTVAKTGVPTKQTAEALVYLTGISVAEQKAAVDSAIKDAGAQPGAK